MPPTVTLRSPLGKLTPAKAKMETKLESNHSLDVFASWEQMFAGKVEIRIFTSGPYFSAVLGYLAPNTIFNKDAMKVVREIVSSIIENPKSEKN
jgi:hypothetical protein